MSPDITSDRAVTPSRLCQRLLTGLALTAVLCAAAAAGAQAVNFVANTAFTMSSVTADSAGNLYGTTMLGGASQNCRAVGCGTVFQLSPASGGGYTMTTIYNFDGNTDGAWPSAGLVIDSKGRLFGTTGLGGTSGDCCGTVFMLSHTQSGWQETILRRFALPDGVNPATSLLLDAHGNLYGTTYSGGAFTHGTVFRLSPTASGWKETILHSFTGGADGAQPLGITFDSAGNIFGNTSLGGNLTNSCGSIYELSFTSGAWREHTLHTFYGKNHDGCNPASFLAFDAAGNLYGTTSGGGSQHQGTVFRFSQVAGAWKESVLYQFTGADDGGQPGALAFSPSGKLFGITNYGAPNGCNSIDGCSQVFQLSQSAGVWSVSATYPTPNRQPSGGGLTFNKSGSLFGTVADFHYDQNGNVFELAP